MNYYWRKVDAGEYQVYIKDLLSYYITNSTKFNCTNTFWYQFSPVYYDDYLKQHPLFAEGISQYGDVNEIAILVLPTPVNNTPVHIDHNFGLNKGKRARLNIPALNCEGSYTCFYQLTEDQYKRGKRSTPRKIEDNYEPGDETLGWSDEVLGAIDPTTQVELVQPTIIRTSSPHNIRCYSNKFPRISVTMSFKDDLVRFLST
jgi:hypothetical protein